MLYVVTAVHNRKSITEKFVQQLKAQTYTDAQLVLVDDGSTDGTAAMVKEELPNAVILQGNGNLWWGGALHKAYRWMKQAGLNCDDYVMFTNDDVVWDNNYIETALAVLKDRPKTLLTGYGVSIQTGEQVDGAVDFRFPVVFGERVNSPQAVGNCASTRSLFFRVSDWLEIGGFHPVLLPHYLSDYEWAIRAHKKGFAIYCTDQVQYGVNEATTGYKKPSFKTIFSKRSVSNPFYKLNFAFMAAPWGKKTRSVCRQIARFAKRTIEKD